MPFINILHQSKKSTLGSTTWPNGKPRDKITVGEIIPAETLPQRLATWGDREGYFQLFDLDAGLQDYAGFFGPHRPAMGRLYFDLDSEKDIEQSRTDALAFCQKLQDLGADPSQIIIRFSGKKGFHIAVPASWFGIEDECWDEQANFRAFCQSLKDEFRSLDTSVTATVGRLRIPSSRHDGSRLYNTRLSLDELRSLTVTDILAKAVRQVPMAADELTPALGVRIKRLAEWYRENGASVLQNEFEQLFKSFNSGLAGYPDKPCVQAIERDGVSETQRHHAMLILASHYMHTKVSREEAEHRLRAFAKKVGLPQDRVRQDPQSIARTIYSGRRTYEYGCRDELKASRCSVLCPIRDTLRPDTRPEIDAQEEKIQREQAARNPEVVPQPLSKHQGFWVQKGKTREPAYEDLLQEFRKEVNYAKWILPQSPGLPTGVRSMIYTGTHWAGFSDLDEISKSWLESKMSPAPMNKHRQEFASKVSANVVNALNRPDLVKKFFLDSIEGKINLANGVWDVRKGELVPRTSDLGFTYVLPFGYEKDAKCPRFKQFLHEICEGDQTKVDRIMLFITYALIDPNYDRHYILFLLGGGGNGKGTLTRFLQKFFGGTQGGYAHLTIESFTQRFDSPMMEGKLLGAVEEISEGETTKAVWNKIKELTGKSLLRVERKNKDTYSVPATCKFIMCSNEPPTLKDNSVGLRRRFRMVWLEKNFTESPLFDPHLDEKLETELPGVFNWILESYKDRYLMEGIPETIGESQEFELDDAAGLMNLEDPIAAFVERFVVEDQTAETRCADLWEAFQVWSRDPDSGVSESDRKFLPYKRLLKKLRMRLGPKRMVRRNNGVIVKGARISDNAPQELRTAKHQANMTF